jgi:transcriptional regulator with XRE-family HTH domain
VDVRGRSERLKRERATRGLTLRAAASQAGISPETLRRIEQGKNARLPAAMAIAEIYERELEDLFELGEPTVEERIISALMAAAEPEQLHSAALTIAYEGMRDVPRDEWEDHPLLKVVEQLEKAAEAKPRRTGVRWELTTGEADTLLEAAAFAAKNADGALAQRANQLVREFRPSQYIDREEL